MAGLGQQLQGHAQQAPHQKRWKYSLYRMLLISQRAARTVLKTPAPRLSATPKPPFEFAGTLLEVSILLRVLSYKKTTH